MEKYGNILENVSKSGSTCVNVLQKRI